MIIQISFTVNRGRNSETIVKDYETTNPPRAMALAFRDKIRLENEYGCLVHINGYHQDTPEEAPLVIGDIRPVRGEVRL